jgi:hypothetical protein
VKGALDPYNIATILRSFSRSQENQMSGSDKLFFHLEPTIIAQLDNFTTRDLSHVLYAYSIREVGNPEFYRAMDNKISQIVESGEILDYPTLSNLIYYLMFRDNTDEKVWRHVIECTLSQDEVLPITYYKPFKFSRFFLMHKLPQIDLQDYVDKFYYAERYFNQV